ncbi:MAG: efflux RND transporter periplasmic adaptor subunit [Armatimonadetes bacterium]|nr:efflux RND transporter periplasmic adaptor subunit [Armatimonadota bacterium]
MTKLTKRIVIGAIVLAGIAAVAIPKIISMQEEQTGPKGGATGGGGRGGSGSPQAVSVKGFVASQQILDGGMMVPGTIIANESVELRSEASGRVVSLNFSEGKSVGNGALLVKINDQELQAQLKQATYRQQLSEAKERRQHQLLQKEAVSQAEYDVALSELNTATAQIDLIRAQIAKTEVRAPFAGRVGLRSISQGSYISPTTPIATLYSIDPIKVEFSIPEKYAGMMEPGTEVAFTVQGSDRRFHARVFATEPMIDPATRTLLVRAQSPNADGEVQPGAFAQISLPVGNDAAALLIPAEAVIPEADGQKVFVAKDGKAVPKPIKAGVRTETMVQVLGGLQPGDTVITSGVLSVRPGAGLKFIEVANATNGGKP